MGCARRDSESVALMLRAASAGFDKVSFFFHGNLHEFNFQSSLSRCQLRITLEEVYKVYQGMEPLPDDRRTSREKMVLEHIVVGFRHGAAFIAISMAIASAFV